MDFYSDEELQEFLTDTQEILDQLDQSFLVLESKPNDFETINEVFRSLHTIKGGAGFMSLDLLEKLTHVGENLLVYHRDSKIGIQKETLTLLYSLIDASTTIIGNLSRDSNEGKKDYHKLVQRFETQLHNLQDVIVDPEIIENQQITSFENELNQIDDLEALQEMLLQKNLSENLENKSIESNQNLEEDEGPISDSNRGVQQNHLRIDVDELDKLMVLVEELVLARNQLLQFTNEQENPNLQNISKNIDRITTELQGKIVKTRMQAIQLMWKKLPRVLRELSQSYGKDIQLKMEGGDTELDKAIIDAIRDPLTHIIRNSVCHGIETPEERLKAGKPKTGTIFLKAFHEGGQINIFIKDDGAGLCEEKILQRAISQNLVNSEDSDQLSKEEILNFIFHAGFSTAEAVDNVSGRGVGMDVVRSNVEKIGGSLELDSTKGKGLEIRIRLPLTLAIIPALIVRVADEILAIPQVNLYELIMLQDQEIEEKIEYVHGTPVFRLRDKLLPLVDLAKVLNLGKPKNKNSFNYINIVIVHAGSTHFGLILDQVLDTQEIVVKPLSDKLKNISIFAGATILSDGKVGLILDIAGIKNLSMSNDNIRRESSSTTVSEVSTKQNEDMFLIFEDEREQRLAIPLKDVHRLEEVPNTNIEYSGGKEVLQYRGEILPLIRVHPQIHDKEQVQIVVFNFEEKLFGIVVQKILDITTCNMESKQFSSKASILYNLIIQNKVTEVLNLQEIAQNQQHLDPSDLEVS
ncbi:chemotaxis protein CheA [bacterium]|nr:chemotaxis protein CheA [bacterium]